MPSDVYSKGRRKASNIEGAEIELDYRVGQKPQRTYPRDPNKRVACLFVCWEFFYPSRPY